MTSIMASSGFKRVDLINEDKEWDFVILQELFTMDDGCCYS